MKQAEKKKLGLLDIFGLGVGGTIGSGIFVMLGSGIGYTGRSIVLALCIASVYILFAYLYHPIMASMFVMPGGDYDMRAMLLGPTMTGFSALVTLLNGFGMASFGMAFSSYFVSVFTSLEPYQNLIAAALMLVFFGMSLGGTKMMSSVTTVITFVLLASIAMFVIMGVPQVKPGFWSNEDGLFWANGAQGFISAIAIMAFACQGTTQPPVSVMATTKKARRTIPLGILLITITVGIVYALMGYVASGVLPVEQVMGQNLSLVAGEIFTPTLFKVFILGAACCAIMSSLCAGIVMQRYPLLAVAEDGWLPKVFKRTTKNGYPYMVMGLLLAFSILPLFTDLTIDTLISLVMIPTMAINAYMNISLIKLVKDYPEQWKNATLHMPTPVFNVVCVASAACALAVAYYLFKDMNTTSMILCVVVIAAMIILSQISLRTGSVKKEDLLAKREEIAAAAIAATAAED
ncbi:APC family permease [Vermiculatibacterium agrestimuris]|uniref:APC family permease n=1 Tax=Vermiculatibacterium agrestimuris TaxID=2941519 RepID=UPI00203E685F|nr:APC family permease [Vermiculatibacterium agrestimuris]